MNPNDSNITSLNQYTTPQSTDVLPIVDVANNETKKIQIPDIEKTLNIANMTGTLVVNRGGTGLTAPTGYLKGTGTSVSQVTNIPISDGGTGQTTANGALNAFLPTQTGNSAKFLTTDGTNTSWGLPASTAPIVRVYTTSGTWTKPANLKYIVVEGVGGSTGYSSTSSGSGAPSAGYFKKLFDAASLSANESFVVGVAGAAAYPSGATDTTFKTCTAGHSYNNPSFTPGSASGGDINIPGQLGGPSSNTYGFIGSGGDTPLGFGGKVSAGGATGYGSGQGGTTASAAANGMPGILIITEYYI